MEKVLFSIPYGGIGGKVGIKFNLLKTYISLKTSLAINREFIILSTVGVGI